MRKMLPIGIEQFEDIRRNGYYYVDKTDMIRELFHHPGFANLFVHPRRFGKNLNLSMLECFLSIGNDPTLFNGLKISEDRELFSCGNRRGLMWSSPRNLPAIKTIGHGRELQT